MSIANFAKTLTSGIQDVSALLPLLGTEQCEKHVGSALEGGFLYAAATPLSIFGSLGTVRAGISVLVASISIPKPSLSLLSFPEGESVEPPKFPDVPTVAFLDPTKTKSEDQNLELTSHSRLTKHNQMLLH